MAAKRKAAKPEPEGPQPPNAEAASSTASAEASPAEGNSRGFIADPGPDFDPEGAPAPEAEVEPELEEIELEEWEEEVISSLLVLKGRLIHAGAGIAEEDWLYTELDLAAIVPPLTRILNRYPAIRRYAPYADPITLLTAVGAYGIRSVEERKRVLRMQQEAVTEQPIGPAGPPPPAAAPSVPAPPPPPGPSAFPAGAGRQQPQAPVQAQPSVQQAGADGLEWSLEG